MRERKRKKWREGERESVFSAQLGMKEKRKCKLEKERKIISRENLTKKGLFSESIKE